MCRRGLLPVAWSNLLGAWASSGAAADVDYAVGPEVAVVKAPGRPRRDADDELRFRTPPVRLQALADGVFAIAMTLLVLELAVPAMVAGELADALLEMWPEFLMYTLSFLVLGVYWLIHHMVFDSIRRYDSALVWLNIAYLMFAALIPFSTALIVEYGATTTTAVVYGLNMLLLFLVPRVHRKHPRRVTTRPRGRRQRWTGRPLRDHGSRRRRRLRRPRALPDLPRPPLRLTLRWAGVQG